MTHGLDTGGRVPEPPHLQAVVGRLAPKPTALSRLRWSSVVRISHRIVGRTVRHATRGTESDPDDPDDLATVMPREAQLLDVLRGRPGHAVLLHATALTALTEAATNTATAAGADAAGADAAESDAVVTIAVLARDTPPTAPDTLPVPAYRDTAGGFARLYRPDGPTGFVVRPDGHLGARFPLAGTATALSDCLTLLTECGTPPRTGPGPGPWPTGRPA